MFNLFHLLGCLPDGIKKQHLAKLCPFELEIEEGLKVLESLSFLEPDDEGKVCLTSFLLKFAKGSIENQSEKNMMETIGEFYTDFLMQLFKINSAIDMQGSGSQDETSKVASMSMFNLGNNSKSQEETKKPEDGSYQDRFKDLIKL